MPKIYFNYERKFLGVETGVVSVSVDDPHDTEEMRRLLNAGEFETFLPEQREMDTQSWKFTPRNLQ